MFQRGVVPRSARGAARFALHHLGEADPPRPDEKVKSAAAGLDSLDSLVDNVKRWIWFCCDEVGGVVIAVHNV